jgi:hypothetical protein
MYARHVVFSILTVGVPTCRIASFDWPGQLSLQALGHKNEGTGNARRSRFMVASVQRLSAWVPRRRGIVLYMFMDPHE